MICGKRLNTSFHNKNKNYLQILLQSESTNLNPQDKDGKTPLMIACQHSLEFAQMLLQDKRIDINTKDNEGRTALRYACQYDQGILIEQLLENPVVDINAVDKVYLRPAHTHTVTF